MNVQLVENRLNKGLSIRAAADEMGVAAQSLRRAEGGESVIPQVAFKIASFYGHKVTDLWPVVGDPASDSRAA